MQNHIVQKCDVKTKLAPKLVLSSYDVDVKVEKWLILIDWLWKKSIDLPEITLLILSVPFYSFLKTQLLIIKIVFIDIEYTKLFFPKNAQLIIGS